MAFRKRSHMKQLLTKANKARILDAIQQAESETSGEIRVHIETTLKNRAAFERATELFYTLNMQQTSQRNGVLLYIALDDRQFAIIGDEGIHERVGAAFWEAEKETISAHFKRGDFIEGIVSAIVQVGEKLKQYFPRQQEDIDELRNEISIGETIK